MEFVAERVSNYEQERNPKPAGAKEFAGGSSERARGKQREDCVFSKVAGLANDEMDGSERRFAGMRKQPQHRPQHHGGVRAGQHAARTDEDQRRPHHERAVTREAMMRGV